jgi:hypothetical protein
MLSALLAVSLAAAEPAAPLKVAVTDLAGANVAPETLASFVEHLAAELRRSGLSVITSREIGNALGIERQKQLMGCSTDDCMTELTNALGTDGVLHGTIGHIEDIFQIDLKIMSATGTGTLATYSTRVSSEKAVLDALDTAAKALSAGMHTSLHRPVPEGALVKGTNTKVYALIPGGLAVALAVTGAVLLTIASNDHAALIGTKPISLESANAAAGQGDLFQWTALACFSIATGALVAAGAVVVLGGPPKQTFALAPVPGGAALSWMGVFP